MCLVLKLDNGKGFSIANEQTDRISEPSRTVLVYRFKIISNSLLSYVLNTMLVLQKFLENNFCTTPTTRIRIK